MKNTEYEACISMRTSEAQIQWDRFSAILIANTIFTGFIGLSFNKDFFVPWIIKIIFPVFGVVLCFFWFIMTQRGFMWTKFWTEKAREIEKKFENSSIRPFTAGLEKKNTSHTLINTENGAKIVILMFAFTYFYICYYFISQVVNPTAIISEMSIIYDPSILIQSLAMFAALASAFAAWKAFTFSRDGRKLEVHKMFLDLMLRYDFSKRNDQIYLNTYWFGRVCDFFEYACNEASKGRLNSADLELLKVVMTQKEYMQYARKRNKFNNKSYAVYCEWLEKKNNSS